MRARPSPDIRPSRTADRQAVIDILDDTFVSTWKPNITANAAKRFHAEQRPARYFDLRGDQFMIAELDGKPAGFVDWEGDFIHALHVHSAYARCGVGSALLTLAEREIAASDRTRARLETDTFNTRSRAFYKKHGYVETDRYPDEEWHSGLTTILLEKPLLHRSR